MKNFFRVVIPRAVDIFLTLVGLIINKDTADGVDSKLTSVDMDSMATLYQSATALHAESEALSRDKETAIEERNLALGIALEQKTYTPGTVLYYITSIRDYLLGVYKGAEQKLGDWSFTVDHSRKGLRKVVVPRNPDKLIKLAEGVLEKHTDDDVDSILSHFDMAEFADLITLAKEKQALAQKLDRDKEDATQKRNIALGFGRGRRRINQNTLLHLVVSVRDVLAGIYKGNEQALGGWGFVVNTSQSPSEPTLETTVSGTVTDSVSGNTISGVMVHFHTSAGVEQATSNAVGEYNISLDLEGSEPVTIEVNHAGYMPYSVIENVTAGEGHTFDIVLQPL